MENYTCKSCGTILQEGQDFCPKCGSRKESNSICSKCGNALAEGTEFCPKCGTKVGAVNDAKVMSAISEFNKGVEQSKTKQGKKKIGVIAVVAVVAIALLLFVFKDSIIPFTGTYKQVNADSNTTYTFTKDNYTYKSDDDSYSGTYTKNGKVLTLKDKDGDSDNFTIYQSFIYDSSTKYDEALNVSSGYTTQTLKNKYDFTYKGSDITVSIILELKDDGTYKRILRGEYDYSSKDISTESGTYEIQGNTMVFTTSDNKTFYNIINNGYVYSVVYQKQ